MVLWEIYFRHGLYRKMTRKQQGSRHALKFLANHQKKMGIKCLRRKAQGRPQSMEQERRRSPRFPFIAAAEVHEESNGWQLSARVSDISATGCYVDTINPLPVAPRCV
jgi:PilZ domain-containing protein